MQPQVRIVPLDREPIDRVIPDGGVMALEEVNLCDRYERMLAEAILSCSGPAFWRHRKKAESRSLLALAQVSGRLVVHELDLAEALRAVIGMETPVPCRPDESRFNTAALARGDELMRLARGFPPYLLCALQ